MSCEVPAIQTVASDAVFEITAAGSTKGVRQSANKDSMVTAVFDGENLPGIGSTGRNCYVQVDFTDGMVGKLDEMRFFMDYFPDSSKFAGHLVFQGSNDDFSSDAETIITVDYEIHEGWNYYDLTEIAPRYQSYRLFNA